MAFSLDRWLATASKATVAFVAIAGGIFFIIMSDPPQTVCDTQLGYFRTQQGGFLFPGTDSAGKALAPSYGRMAKYCRENPGPGGCYEWFARLRRMTRDLETIPMECSEDAAAVDEVRDGLWVALNFMAASAWGEKAPASFLERFGWLDQSDLELFCKMKQLVVRFYGEESWSSWSERLLKELPGAKDLPRKDAWERMILSEDCRRHSTL